ncbi:AI-2E family transporter [Fructilactobacillus myrtifloralis]|uniref:AI-2E family transporter n=1 Tax=Fructilactobacillus myrtifloralis TaxID=2940301 RepID=A0ABY5BP33_9LACO|nr:AI-2E family transporter [Fructilactobacillus myrtifloralis]USS84847.1 AI-2E family transporter [Fructilactobacillus myrtifloralis]
METHWQNFLKNVQLRRAVVLMLLIGLIYVCREMITTILLTFIFTLLVTKAVLWVRKRVQIPTPLLVIGLYLLIVGSIVVIAVLYLPTIVEQGIEYSKVLYKFYQRPHTIENPQVRDAVVNLIKTVNVPKQLKDSMGVILDYVTSAGNIGFSMFISLLLSFFFTLELKQTKEFSEKFLSSTFGWFFQDVAYFGNIFVKTFGVVLEAQFFIAICNTVLTTICLAILGMPQLVIFAIMIFLLSLVPVAGVILSLIPLSISAYTVGGIRYVIYVIIIVVVVHMLEAYVLNPKFMSSKTELPIFYTFVVLLIGEHFWGTWGLIVAVPVFTFFLDVFGVQKVDRPRLRKPKPKKKNLKNATK